jgi:uncharacterized protein YijF (DUF1287 family)
MCCARRFDVKKKSGVCGDVMCCARRFDVKKKIELPLWRNLKPFEAEWGTLRSVPETTHV